MGPVDPDEWHVLYHTGRHVMPSMSIGGMPVAIVTGLLLAAAVAWFVVHLTWGAP